jgi:uncharacterized protein YecE (DUF72 family)
MSTLRISTRNIMPTLRSSSKKSKPNNNQDRTSAPEPKSPTTTAPLSPPPPQLYSLSKPSIHIGCSGYSYPHWHDHGSFYGPIISTPKEFPTYSSQFNFVELNSTFYKFPSSQTFLNWQQRAAAAGNNFIYSIKASQLYTHRKRLNCEDDFFKSSFAQFWERCNLLQPHLGPILFQLPKTFKTTTSKGIDNINRLDQLSSILPPQGKFVFEFRDASWFCPQVYNIFRKNTNWCLALIDVGDNTSTWAGNLHSGTNPAMHKFPEDICSWGLYIRFHGSQGGYGGAYGARVMREWAERIKRWEVMGKEVWVAFNNDGLISEENHMPAAVSDARDLYRALKDVGVF